MLGGRHTFGAAVLAVIPLVQAAAQLPDLGAPFIFGVVVDSESGRPVPSAVVRLTSDGLVANRQLADSVGRFVFRDLLRGRSYALNASSPGYFATDQFDNSGVFPEIRPLQVVPGRSVTPVHLFLQRQSAIAGLVVDHERRPLPHVRVLALLMATIGGRQHLVVGAKTETDDRGIYELQGLVAGEYIVSAQLPGPRTGVVYYPAAATLLEAGSLSVAPGMLHEGVLITLRPTEAVYTISGSLNPPPSDGPISVSLVPRGSESLGRAAEAATTITGRNGTFQFPYVSKGSYTIRVTPTSGQFQVLSSALSSVRALRDVVTTWGSAVGHRVQGAPGVLGFLQDERRQRYWASVATDVIDSDVDNVTVPVTEAATARIIVRHRSEETLTNPAQLIVVEPSPHNDMVVVPEVFSVRQFNDEHELLASGITPGTYFVRTRSDRLAVATVSVGDRTLLGGSFVSPEQASVTVELSRTGEIGGIVEARDNVALDSVVFCFPRDPAIRRSYGLVSSTMRAAKPKSDGSFRVAGLAVGEYFVVAVRNLGKSLSWDDEAFLGRMSAVADIIQVRNDSPTRISLRVQTLPK